MMVLMRNDLVGIIDEMDRSLHPEILHSYVANFLKDLQHRYLQGRFGGVPLIKGFSWLGSNDGNGT